MSKRAFCFLLTLLMTTSIFFFSVNAAFAEELTEPEIKATATEAPSTVTATDATGTSTGASQPSSAPEPTVSKARFPVLTVNAISNYFGKAYAEYNEYTKEVTVTYMLKASKRLVTVGWKLTYDSSILSVDPEKNLKNTICPIIKDNCAVSFDEEGVVRYCATDLKMFDFTATESTFAQIVFDVTDLTVNDSEITKVDLSVEDLWVSEPDPVNGQSVKGKERVLVANGKEIENKKTDAVLVSKVTSLTPSTFSEPDLSGATPDEALTTAPVTQPTTVQPTTSAPVVKAPKKQPPAKTDSVLVPTGEWYIALLILLLMFICSIVLFILRKRDIYNNL